MPAGRKSLDDEMPIGEWLRLRTLQSAGWRDGVEPWDSVTLSDDLSMNDWQRLRERQLGGEREPLAASQPVRMYAVAASTKGGVSPSQPAASGTTQPRKPLTGRPGAAAVVAGALNTIASGPNTSAPIRTKGVDGVVRRGTGRDVSAEGKIKIPKTPIGTSVWVDGMLEAPTGRAEITISKPRGRAVLGPVDLPDHVRFFNTPSGELDVHLPSDVKIGPFTIRKAGDYYIGQPDPPRRK